MIHIPRRSSQAAALLLVLLSCAGCASGGAVHNVAKATGFATDAPESADFVKATRTEQLNYRPVGVKPPDRAQAPFTTEEIDALKADLDSKRARNESEAATAKALGNTPMVQPPVIPPLD